ncbi:MAG: hypothetical protein LBI92_02895 [Azoarcus sp.]|nr:hypothetical protein [Azoarcus sp.]
MNHPYYIFAPGYTSSSEGKVALHHLCHALNTAGQEAWIFFADKVDPKLATPKLTLDLCRQHETDGRAAIGVYPETIGENLLRTPVCVHYLLNKEGLITGSKVNAEDGDLFFYYSRACTPEPQGEFDFLSPPLYDLDLFKPDPRRTHLKPFLYINRIPEAAIDFSALPLDIEILSNQRPVPLPKLAEILQGASVLYTYEFSGTNVLAMLCGCPVLILEHPQYRQLGHTAAHLAVYPGKGYTFSDTPEEIEQARLHLPKILDTIRAGNHHFFQSQLPHFIRKTQTAAQEIALAGSAPLPSHEFPRLVIRMTLLLAIQAFNRGENETAIYYLNQVVRFEPDNPIIYVHMALVCVRISQIEQAEALIAHALALAPERRDFLTMIGKEFLKNGHSAAAARYLEKTSPEFL